MKLLHHIASFVESESATSATEYAVMLSLIVLASVGAISLLGGKVSAVFSTLNSKVPA